MRIRKQVLFGVVDLVLMPAVLVLAPLAAALSRLRDRAPLSRWILEKVQVAAVRHHCYEPIFFPPDLKHDHRTPRQITGLDLNESAQLGVIENFKYRDELPEIPVEKTAPDQF